MDCFQYMTTQEGLLPAYRLYKGLNQLYISERLAKIDDRITKWDLEKYRKAWSTNVPMATMADKFRRGLEFLTL